MNSRTPTVLMNQALSLMNRRLISFYATLCSLSLFPLNPSHACTALTLLSEDGSAVQARTMEWGAFDMEPAMLVIPQNYSFEGELPDGTTGLTWKSQFGAMGINALGKPLLADGINEKGLAVSMLYLPGFAEYQPYTIETASRSISQNQLALWVLTNCASIADLRYKLPAIRVVPVPEESIGGIPAPFHLMVTDRHGKNVVVEYTKGELQIFDNPVGVLTNSPDFSWHLTNLGNYVMLGIGDVEPITVGDLEIRPLGAGSGMLGLPGDYTPPSRFVRVAAMRNSVPALETGGRAVEEAFRILNNFDIPIGTMGGNHDPAILGDTQWTSAMDTQSLHYYYRTMNNHRIRVVDLNTIDFSGSEIVSRLLDLKRAQDYEKVSF